MSCHIDELRPSDTNAITLELAQGTRISRLFYGALEEPGLDRQTSELSSNMEGVVFERVISTEERVEEAIEEGEREREAMEKGEREGEAEAEAEAIEEGEREGEAMEKGEVEREAIEEGEREAIEEGEGEGEAMEDEEGGEAMEEGVREIELGGQGEEMEIVDIEDEGGSSEGRGSQPDSTEEPEEAVESSESHGSQPDSTEEPEEAVESSESHGSQPDSTEEPEEAVESSESHGSQPDSTEEPEEAVESSESHGSQPDSTEEPEESSQSVEREDSFQPPHGDTQSMSGTGAAPLGTRPFSDVHTQCVRLNNCIQAAASRLQDSSQNNQRAAERVRLLIQVIPRKPTFPLGKLLLLLCTFVFIPCINIEPNTFYAVLVAHIHRMLCERETVYRDDDWVMNEAMDMHHLQTGGTFMNVLTRKLDDIIVPCLAEIIAFVDRRSNLSLLQIEHSPLSQFWLKMFASKRSEEALRFTDMVTNQKVQMMDENFACEFPFSWLVKELLDSLWDSAQSIGGYCLSVCVHVCVCACVRVCVCVCVCLTYVC